MTCCMQWKIAVDDETYHNWKKVDFGYKSLSSFTTKVDGSRVIRLNDAKRCPFLSENGLCSLVMEHGDRILSETCDTFPRQVHDFGSRREFAVVSCCPEVIDMMRDEKLEFDGEVAISDGEFCENVRNLMIWLVSNENYPLNAAILMAYHVLHDIYENDITDLRQYTDKKLLDVLYERICQVFVAWKDTYCENNELWLDVATNYRKEGLYSDFIEEISLKAEEILDNFGRDNEDALQDEWDAFVAELSKYQGLFRNYVANEIFSNMLVPELELSDMLVTFQWIMMEYVVIRQGIYLKMKVSGQMPDYETIRDYIVVVSRMTGYDYDDIYEYMENCFQSVIWQWFYAALIIG